MMHSIQGYLFCYAHLLLLKIHGLLVIIFQGH